MTKTKFNLIPGLSALASFLICSSAFAGLNGSNDAPLILKGGAAPVDPLTIHTFPDNSQPFAFADFPDLPGRVPPPTDDKGPKAEDGFDPLGPDTLSFGEPKRLPPDSGQTFGLPLPDFAGGVPTPMMPRPEILQSPNFHIPVRDTLESHSVPGPGSAWLLVAGAAAMRRRRR